MNHRTHILLVFLLAGLPLQLCAQGWALLQTTNNPPARRNASAIYDPVNNRMIVFGGKGSSGDFNDLWGLNLNTLTWEQLLPAGGAVPAPRFTQNAVFDSARNRMIIWSGQGAELYNDVWAFDFSSRTWQQLWANGNVSGAPVTRYGTAATFDPVQRRLINFAGFGSTRYEDTWHFDIDNLAWTDKTNNNNPMLRCLHTGCFVPDRRLMIVYGGQRSGTLDDIWSLNVDSFVWTNLTPAIRPAGRWFSSVVYDAKGHVIMFGGQTAQGASNELWRFSFTANVWESMQAGTQQPAARFGHAAIYVPSRNSMIVFGGGSADLFNDTWEFTFSSVTGVEQTPSPRDFVLDQNYPNPFNPTTNFGLQIPDFGLVILKVFDLLGREVATVFSGNLQPGTYRMSWSAGDLPTGVYLYRLQANGFVETKKMILAK